jgi:hypothetical protein
MYGTQLLHHLEEVPADPLFHDPPPPSTEPGGARGEFSSHRMAEFIVECNAEEAMFQ